MYIISPNLVKRMSNRVNNIVRKHTYGPSSGPIKKGSAAGHFFFFELFELNYSKGYFIAPNIIKKCPCTLGLIFYRNIIIHSLRVLLKKLVLQLVFFELCFFE